MSQLGAMAPYRPSCLCVDVGNVLLMPDVAVVAPLLRDALDRPVDQRTFYEAIVLADREAHRHPDPAEFWDGDEMALAWGRYLGLAPADAIDTWNALMDADERGQGVWTRVNPDARLVLEELRAAGVQLLAVSNASGHVAEELAAARLDHYFTAILDSTTVGLAKPDPRIFEAAAASVLASPDRCWHIEDTPYELTGVIRAGFALALLYDPLDVYPDSPGYMRLRTLTELLDLIGTPDQGERYS